MRRTNCEQWRLAIVVNLVFITFSACAAQAGATRSNGPDSLGAGGNKDHRTANVASRAQEQRYLADSEWARLYRVTPRAAPVLQPFAQPSWRERAWKNEEEIVPVLQAGLERLKQAILSKTARVQARPLESIKVVPDSKDVLLDDPASSVYRKNVMGESPDAPYRMSAENGEPANFLLGNDDMVVVYGLNHAATKISTYSSFAVYRHDNPGRGSAHS